jgi:hypothetical protein
MVEIARLVRSVLGEGRLFDKRLAWGARICAYAREIADATARGLTPVLVELTGDDDVPPGAIEVDHHGARAGEPCSLAQVFSLLRLPASRWTREHALVAANDVGHLAGLRAMRASEDEIRRIRAEDRAAQGVTPQEEAAGAAAADAVEQAAPGVLLARLPHERTATVVDPLALAGRLGGGATLLVKTPRGLHAFGSGEAVAALREALPGGFFGGDLPAGGFWGLPEPPADALERALSALAKLPKFSTISTME